MKGARRERALSFWHVFLERLLTWLSNFKFLSIAMPKALLLYSIHRRNHQLPLYMVYDKLKEAAFCHY